MEENEDEEIPPKFSDLYKNTSKIEERQAERRRFLLAEQKKQRNVEIDSARGILQKIEESAGDDSVQQKKVKYFYNNNYRHKIQFSEWMYEKPDDLENWFMVPCPVGSRCLLVLRKGVAIAYDVKGKSVTKFKTVFPRSSKLTILDCIVSNNVFYTLDVLAFNDIDVVNCECQFRFNWLKMKFEEEDLVNHFAVKKEKEKMKIQQIPFVDFMDPMAIDECLMRFPMFDKNIPKLDGLLFYHKESHYVYGQTPLVTWLFPFMVPEVLHLNSVHQGYFIRRPPNYVNYREFIRLFNEKLQKKRLKRSKQGNRKMETDEIPADDEENGQKTEMELMEMLENEETTDFQDISDIHESSIEN